MEKSVRGAIGALLQTNQKLGKVHGILPFSTLNQKLDIFPNELPGANDKNFTNYLTIGIGGHTADIVNGRAKFKTLPHLPRHTGLYDQIPFVMRLPNNDLSAGERIKYRLRNRFVNALDGKTYVGYWGKPLPLEGVVPSLEYRTEIDGVITATPWTPTADDLAPTPPEITSGGVIISSNDYIAATSKVVVEFTAADVTEMLNAVNLIYGDPGYCIISELGLTSGVDRTLTGDFNGTSLGYTEAVGVQINDFLATMFPAPFMSTGAKINLDTGSVEPLLVD